MSYYELTFRIRMSDKAHALTDEILALPPSDRDAVLLTLRAFDKSLATLTKAEIGTTSSTPPEHRPGAEATS